MKEYIHSTKIEIPLYRGLFVPVLTNSVGLLKEFIPDFEDSKVFAHTIYADREGIEGYHLILNYHYPNYKITHGIIVHEALHVVNMIADMRGLIPSHMNDEPMAYLIEWVTDEIHKFINKHKLEVHANA